MNIPDGLEVPTVSPGEAVSCDWITKVRKPLLAVTNTNENN